MGPQWLNRCWGGGRSAVVVVFLSIVMVGFVVCFDHGGVGF